MLHYIIQFSLFLLLFWAAYRLFFSKETFFTYNRIYLLLTPVLAGLIPFIELDFFRNQLPDSSNFTMLDPVFIGDFGKKTVLAKDGMPIATNLFSWESFFWYAYLLGVLVALILFVVKYRQFLKLQKTGKKISMYGQKVYWVPNGKMACTFFDKIFLGTDFSTEERDQILAHETVHVRQKHSFDLLFFELLKILVWFHPVVYLFQRDLNNVHEFLADEVVTRKTPKATYYQNLLSATFGTRKISFINQFFNHSLIKKRIVMLQKTRSTNFKKLKYILIIPLLLGMLTYVSCSEKKSSANSLDEDSLSQYSYTLKSKEMSDEQRKIHKKYEEFLTNNPDYVSWATIKGDEISYAVHSVNEEVPEGYTKLTVGDKYIMYMNFPDSGENKTNKISKEMEDDGIGVPSNAVDEVPVFPGAENLKTEKERKHFLSENIKNFVNTNYDTNKMVNVGEPGVNRVYVRFKIDKKGNIADVKARAAVPELAEEAERVVKMLPKMQPGKKDGKKVGVLYSLPIVFQIATSKKEQ